MLHGQIPEEFPRLSQRGSRRVMGQIAQDGEPPERGLRFAFSLQVCTARPAGSRPRSATRSPFG